MSTILDAFNLTGKRALVTGSSSGIGSAIALGLAQAGAEVIVHHYNDAAAAQKIAGEIKALGSRSIVITADLSQPDAAKNIFAACNDALGGLDILVSSVAVQIAENWNDISAEHFEKQVRINWQSAFELIQLVAPTMMQRGHGRILTVGSVQEVRPHPRMMIYAGLKAAQKSMVQNLAKQLTPSGVTINNIAPGIIDTPRTRHVTSNPAILDSFNNLIPAGRIGTPHDCVGAALLLCSDAGQYITGQTILIDGGLSLQ